MNNQESFYISRINDLSVEIGESFKLERGLSGYVELRVGNFCWIMTSLTEETLFDAYVSALVWARTRDKK